MFDKKYESKIMDGVSHFFKEEYHDAIFFLPPLNKNEALFIERAVYKNPGEKVSSSMGDMYHIFFFQYGPGRLLEQVEQFDAVLLDPLTYIKGCLKDGLFIGVAKKTDNSYGFVKKLLNEAVEALVASKKIMEKNEKHL